MTQDQIERILWEYGILDKRLDRIEERIERYEAEGNKERAKSARITEDTILAEMEGLNKALLIIGYCTKWQGNTRVIVKR